MKVVGYQVDVTSTDSRIENLPMKIKSLLKISGSSISIDKESCIISIPSKQKYMEAIIKSNEEHILQSLNLSTLQIYVGNTPIKKICDEEDFNYSIVKDLDSVGTIIDSIERCKVYTVDFETTSVDTYKAELIGLGINVNKCNYYIPFNTDDSLDQHYILQLFKPIFEDPNYKFIAHNAKYELKLLQRRGIYVSNYYDTLLASYVEDPSATHGLKDLALRKFGAKMRKFDDIVSETRKSISKEDPRYKSLRDSSINISERKGMLATYTEVDIMGKYCCYDVYYTNKLYMYYEDKFRSEDKRLVKFDHKVLDVIIKMENTGIYIDKEYFYELKKDFTGKIAEITKKIFEIAECEFNINSHNQLGDVIYNKLKIDKPEYTDGGSYKTGVDHLAYLMKKTTSPRKKEFLNCILTYRKLNKLITTYINLPDKCHDDGRIHASFNTTSTATGRLSSSNPNLQNIPTRTEEGHAIRKGIVAQDGYLLCAADYSQIELRILAHYSKDMALVESFNNDEDVHAMVASRIFNKSIDKITKNERNIGKTLNFALIYMQGAESTAEQLGITIDKAKIFIDKYFKTFPKIKNYMDLVLKYAKDVGYTETIYGRRRYYTKINSKQKFVRLGEERQAFNAPIQGTASDIMKQALINLQNLFDSHPEYNAKIVSNVHDEVLVEFQDTPLNHTLIKDLIVETMEKAVILDVPIKVDADIARSYGDAK